MSIKTFALLYGIVFLLAGAGGFIPGLLAPPHTHPDMSVNTGFGYLMGLFPVNVLHNVVHLAFAVWGLAAFRSFGASRTYCRAAGVIYLVLAVLGFVAPDGFGLVPLGGNDIWLHLALGAPLAYFGFTSRDTAAPARATA